MKSFQRKCSISKYLLIAILVASPGLLSAQWPDAIYRLVSYHEAQRVTETILTPGKYVLIDSSAFPVYWVVTSSVDVSTFSGDLPKTLSLRFVSPEDCEITEEELRITVDQLQGRIWKVFLGWQLDWRLDIGTAGTRQAGDITINIQDASGGIYHADPASATITMSGGGLEARILLHELGHISGLMHRDYDCNICTDVTQHFMFEHLDPACSIDQVMFQDWLTLVGVCSGNPLCSTCTPAVSYMEEEDIGNLVFVGRGRSFSDPGLSATSKDSIKNSQLYAPEQFLECIDCELQVVDTNQLTSAKLWQTYNSLPTAMQLQEKFRQEFRYYDTGKLQLTQKEVNRYINKQVERRQRFYSERVLMLVELALKRQLDSRSRMELVQLQTRIQKRL